MTKTVLVLNGPNLNLLGQRQPEIYGHQTLADAHALANETAKSLGLGCTCKQSNHEGQLVDWIQEARGTADGIAINAGAYTHTSIALHDALAAFDGPVVELHLSNVFAREPFRHHSYISPVAAAVIAGCGLQSYEFAIRRLAQLLG